jgi:predicted transcriptional regulator
MTYDPIFKRTSQADGFFDSEAAALSEEMRKLLDLVDGKRTQSQIARLMDSSHNFSRELNELQARGLILAVGHMEFE